jgi:hypothetical protein
MTSRIGSPSAGMPQEIHTSAQYLVAELDQADAQLVIDAWAGALAVGVIQRSPLGYLKTLATRYRADIPSDARMTRSQNAANPRIYPRPLRQSGKPHMQQPKGGKPTRNLLGSQ